MNMTARYSLDDLRYDNRFTRDLPADTEADNFTRQVEGACYSRVAPEPAPAPTLAAYSAEVLETLGLTAEVTEDLTFAEVFGGSRVLSGMDPFAMCYGGHQFGNWAGQLGDGRAINLCEVLNPQGEHWTLQLKGAGPTPYSRMGDGYAVLRSSVREFLCSEAMYHLGVPTTRALSLVCTGQKIMRDMFYNGNARLEPGAVVCRVAPSFVRLGSFQIFSSRRDTENLRRLSDYTIRRDFAHLLDGDEAPTRETYIAWFNEVCRTTAVMMAHWMRVGFVHGVMNTDNMSILGLTIDYGPYGWLEDYDPNWTPNTTDAGGRRYRFGNQPQIALWNLLQWANAIYPLIGETEPLEAGLEAYSNWYAEAWHGMLAQKLGWTEFQPETDGPLGEKLFSIMQLAETDMTVFFRQLANVNINSGEAATSNRLASVMDAFYDAGNLTDEIRTEFTSWLDAYAARCREKGDVGEPRQLRMNAANPRFVLRNYLAQLAIDKAESGDMSMIDELLDVLRNPYDEQPGRESFAEKRPEWARNRPGCSMLSCSS
jgi:serine/tyrosine/threonine adenylyltransferase